jgi:nitroreductase
VTFSSPVSEIIRQRYSCRTYEPRPIDAAVRAEFATFLAAESQGPFGVRGRFRLVTATENDRASLKGLGTYGFIKDAPGFVVGAATDGPKALEDFGYQLERVILAATDRGLATCWLGGTFSKSGFARKIELAKGELMPAVASIGYGIHEVRSSDRIRKSAGSDSRRPPESLFFAGDFAHPLSVADAGPYAPALEAVRWAPSASNRQPWRIVQQNGAWHFYLERTKGYGKGTLLFRLLRLADLQRVDIGIAMCHFELAAGERGLAGAWTVADPKIAAGGREYSATWLPATARSTRD